MTIDLSKKYRTRDGRDVRILCVDAPGPYPVIGYFLRCADSAVVYRWRSDGTQDSGSIIYDSDLVEVREKRRLSGWLNVYRNGMGIWQATKEHADHVAMDDRITNSPRIACVDLSRIEYEVGEGLE